MSSGMYGQGGAVRSVVHGRKGLQSRFKDSSDYDCLVTVRDEVTFVCTVLRCLHKLAVILERDVYVTGVAGSLWRRRFVSLGTVTRMRMYSSVNNGSNIIVFI